ncbi:MAG: efflux RND transporter periplasmic adaptor subunit [Clostridiales Family XIII bacterium]|nr:efflux RND transporter periplasmic adaptor subunit [Clostridiales Family XIII bacterium]
MENKGAKNPEPSRARARKGKGRKRFIAAALCVVLVAAAVFSARMLLPEEAAASEYTEYTVGRGDVSVSLSGSGAIQPNAQFEVASTVGGDVVSDTFAEGDQVGKGDLLYTLDSSEIENTLGRANLSLERSRNNYADTLESYGGLSVVAPMRGRIAELYVQTGDNVGNGGKVAKIVDDRLLSALVPFSAADAGMLSVGQEVTVTVENTFEALPGKISKIHEFSRVADGYLEVIDVEVSIENPGALNAGTYVTVSADGVGSYEGAALEGGSEKIATAKTGGMVDEIYVLLGEYVEAGAQLASLASDSLSNSVRDSGISLQEAELSWENTSKQLENYSITSPIAGSVISKTVKAGDTLEAGTKTVMAVIADMSLMSFTINVDELDIAKVQKGQIAAITVDALADRFFTGQVDNVGLLGSTSNGVTTYPVKIVFDESEGLWPGMNATATIVVDSVSDVLMIPVGAVSRGNLVLVKGDAPDSAASGITESGVVLDDGSMMPEGQGRTPQGWTDGSAPTGDMPEGQGAAGFGGPDSPSAAGGADASGYGPDAAGGLAEGGPADGTGAYAGPGAASGDPAGGMPERRGAPAGYGAATAGGLDGSAAGGMPERRGAPAGYDAATAGGAAYTRSGAASGGGIYRSGAADAPDTAAADGLGVPAGSGAATAAGMGGSTPTGDMPAGTGAADGLAEGGPAYGTGDMPANTGTADGSGAALNAEADGSGAAGDTGAADGAGGRMRPAQGGTGGGGFRSVQAQGPIDQTGAPAGTHYVRVTLGINNDSFIEVISGLEEGQIIMVPVAAENSMSPNMMMFGGPMMPGTGRVEIRNAGGATTVRQAPGGGTGGANRSGGQ